MKRIETSRYFYQILLLLKALNERKDSYHKNTKYKLT